uniref:Uncharacterized protein n=1 Tax=Timema monikensis TaxID=170555 RepID=A0A7R9HS61_9NEOP|nr:unnamed protein product [Timema monikensis]
MSSSCCLAPLPSRMEAFTMRLCVRAAEQYERLLEFNKKKDPFKRYVFVRNGSRCLLCLPDKILPVIVTMGGGINRKERRICGKSPPMVMGEAVVVTGSCN